MSKEPYVSISAAFYAKQLPKYHLGLRSENWTFGKTKSVPLDWLIAGMSRRLIDFYATTMPDPVEDINKAIQRAAKRISELRIPEGEPEVPDATMP